MASLPSEHLTAAHVQRLLDTPTDPRMFIGAWDIMDDARKNPTPHRVHYQTGYKITYTPPNHFYFAARHGPSDCTWIVPGTLKDTSDL